MIETKTRKAGRNSGRKDGHKKGKGKEKIWEQTEINDQKILIKKKWKRSTKRTEETNKAKQREDCKTMQTGHT